MKKKGKVKKHKVEGFHAKVELITTQDDQLFMVFPTKPDSDKVHAFGMGLEDAMNLAMQIVDLVTEHVNVKVAAGNGKRDSAQVFDFLAERVQREGEHERTD